MAVPVKEMVFLLEETLQRETTVPSIAMQVHEEAKEKYFPAMENNRP
jgi:hypothetical protein